MPCHAGKVEKATYHTNHKAGSKGNLCISCHMPQTGSSRIRRSDHSMLPPAPSASLAFGSPNACNACHGDKNPDWADEWARKWRKRDYQAPVLERGRLIEAGRKRDWSRLDHMLAYLKETRRDEFSAASLLRLLESCPDPEKWPAVAAAAEDKSPLVRAAALENMADFPGDDIPPVLLAGLADESRLVRIKAAEAFLAHPEWMLDARQQAHYQRASRELVQALQARPDLRESQYDAGNYHMETGQGGRALKAYRDALRLNPRAVPVRVELAKAHARMGRLNEAERQLKLALAVDPQNAPVNFNLVLLAAERQQRAQAEGYLRMALKSDPGMAQAAYNLALFIADKEPEDALELLNQAWILDPSPRYSYALAYKLNRAGRISRAVDILNITSERWPDFGRAYLLLA